MGSGSPDRCCCLLPNVRLQLSLPGAVFPSLPGPEHEANALLQASALRAHGCSGGWGTGGPHIATLEMFLYCGSFLPAGRSKWSACVLHGTFQVTLQGPVVTPPWLWPPVEGGVQPYYRPALSWRPWPTNTMLANCRYLTSANMVGVLLLDPNGTERETPPNGKPHFHKSVLRLHRNRRLS